MNDDLCCLLIGGYPHFGKCRFHLNAWSKAVDAVSTAALKVITKAQWRKADMESSPD